MQRTLTLKAERLTDLTSAELAVVAGGDASQLQCVSQMFALCDDPSRLNTLCHCFTGMCSIDIC